MDTLEGKNAVVTGGANGMGKAFAQRFLAAGMNVTIGDIEEPVLATTLEELGEPERLHGLRTDVSDPDSMAELAAAAEERFGPTGVVCLNAGVAGGMGSMETLTLSDWRWVMGVNLNGIINGVISFLGPLKERDEGHVVITASVAGLTSFPSMGPYNMTKHAAVSIAETLIAELTVGDSKVGVSCLCPGLVMTGIFQSERNRPEIFKAPGVADPGADIDPEIAEAMLEVIVTNAKPPEHVADLVHDAILADQFWIFTDDDFDKDIAARLDAIAQRRPPTSTASLLEQYL
ncbi:MAG: SDR family NAD(P)-dependent oxidoreductase [Acidobacteria bacterium]|nr:SDR family NAD(P)-dependent oxidoreductase [Acidobacteriota bacterium]